MGKSPKLIKSAPCDDVVHAINRIYRRTKKLSDGAEGGVSGFNGSIRAKALAKLLMALCVEENELVDFGAGSGRVLFSAVAAGASRAYGYELPVNKGMKYVFDAAVRTSASQDCVEWIGKDILSLTELNGSPSCAFSFWVGFPLPVQKHILQLCAENESVQTIAVFKDSKWTNYMHGMC